MPDVTPPASTLPRGPGFVDAFRSLPPVPPDWPDACSIGEAKKLLREWVAEIERRTAERPPDSARAAKQRDSAVQLLRQAGTGILRGVQFREPPPPAPQPESRLRRVWNDIEGAFGTNEYRSPGYPAGPYSPPAPPRGTPEPTVSIAGLRSHLHILCEQLDAMLTLAEPPPPERVPISWAEDRDLVALLQDLLHGWHTGHGAKLNATVDRLAKQLLLRRGIEVHTTYTAGLFNVAWLPPADRSGDRPRTVRVVRPALVYREDLKAQGEAIEELVDGPPAVPGRRDDPGGGGQPTDDEWGKS